MSVAVVKVAVFAPDDDSSDCCLKDSSPPLDYSSRGMDVFAVVSC